MYEFEWKTFPPSEVFNNTVLCANGGRTEALEEYLCIRSLDKATCRVIGFRGSSVFRDVTIWQQLVVVGYGNDVYAYDPAVNSIMSLNLNPQDSFDYFGSFYLSQQGDFLLVATSKALFRFDHNLVLIWKTEALGIDGVLVKRIESSIIHGESEWDPPGGWRPFEVDLLTGRILTH